MLYINLMMHRYVAAADEYPAKFPADAGPVPNEKISGQEYKISAYERSQADREDSERYG
jgi:hypothetical protein